MRIGNVTPRLNGLGLSPGVDINTIVSTDLASWLSSLAYNMENGTAHTPAQLEQMLRGEIQSICVTWPGQCANADSVIAAAISQYTDSYNREKARVDRNVAAGLISLPGGSVYTPPPPPPVSPSQVQYTSQPPNALDRVTPGISVVTRAAPTNVLAPPQTPVPMSGQNAGTFTGTDTTAKPAGKAEDVVASTSFFDQTISFGNMDIPTWVLLAGAGFGLFLMTKGKGR